MQAEEAQSKLAERVESMGVSEEEKTTGKHEENEQERSHDTNEALKDATAEDESNAEGDKESMDAEEQKDGATADGEMNGGGGGQQQQPTEEDWEIPYSDEEMEDPKNWMPSPEEIKRLYEILAKGEMLELNWEPLPRRPPTPPRTPSPERDGDDSQDAKQEDNQRKALTPTEFDFDEEQTMATPKNSFLSRRRTPGSSGRSTVKREARLDKVLSDMKRHRKIEEQILRTGRDLFKSDKRGRCPSWRSPCRPTVSASGRKSENETATPAPSSVPDRGDTEENNRLLE
ncbi:PAXIP1-associated glutamate-rich 1 [Labeo rohita]|uniref:PAXIP1-associated glutamate-rich 1 n=1 Tax=Labeo rohita TaxID=84645 RepID=A0A498MSG7_LABRO|nr:PAXIP1-associated glutamate-rich 1 [Labeo rohita]